MTPTAETIIEFNSPDEAHALVRSVAADSSAAIACACRDAIALMREVLGFPRDGIPGSEEWPALIERTSTMLETPARVLFRQIDTPAPIDQIVQSLLDGRTATPLTDVLVMPDTAAPLDGAARERLVALAHAHGVRVHVGARSSI